MELLAQTSHHSFKLLHLFLNLLDDIGFNQNNSFFPLGTLNDSVETSQLSPAISLDSFLSIVKIVSSLQSDYHIGNNPFDCSGFTISKTASIVLPIAEIGRYPFSYSIWLLSTRLQLEQNWYSFVQQIRFDFKHVYNEYAK